MEKEDLIGRYFANEDTRIRVVSDPGGNLLTVEITATNAEHPFGEVGDQWDTDYVQLMSAWNLQP